MIDSLAGPMSVIERRVGALEAGRRVAVAVEDLATGERAGLDERTVLPSASLIKLPILVAALREVDAGRLTLATTLPVRDRHRVGGAGVLGGRREVAEAAVGDLLDLMITISDNTATNVLIDALGITAIAELCAPLGMVDTRLRRTMMDTAALAAGRDNLTTAADVTAVLVGLAEHRYLTARHCAVALDLLHAQRVNDRLPRHLPPGWTLAHKTGELAGIRHDAGIACLEGRPRLVVAVLTSGFTDAEDEACELVADIGAALWASGTRG